MIVGADRPKEVGKRYEMPVTDIQGNPYRLPFVVLREATEEEWIEDMRNSNASEERIKETLSLSPDAFYYQISID